MSRFIKVDWIAAGPCAVACISHGVPCHGCGIDSSRLHFYDVATCGKYETANQVKARFLRSS